MTREIGLVEFQTIIVKVMSQGMTYFGSGSILHLTVSDGGEKVDIQLENVFKNKPSMDAALLKLAHNISMMNAFCQMVFNQINDYTFYSRHNLDKSKTFYLRINILNEDVKILERKGFGFLTYNESDMVKVLRKYKVGYINYFKNMITELKNKGDIESANDIERVLNFAQNGYSELDVNMAMFSFIQNNIDLYSKYLD